VTDGRDAMLADSEEAWKTKARGADRFTEVRKGIGQNANQLAFSK